MRPARLALLLGLSLACRPAGSPPPGQLLAAARRALGPAADSVRSLRAVATVAAPTRTFAAEVLAARDGRVRLTLGGSLRAGIDRDTAWLCGPGDSVLPLDAVTRSVVRGHALHMLVLAPLTWLRDPTPGPRERWQGDTVWTVTLRDELAAPLLLRLRVRDTLPVGLDLVNHSGEGPREVRVLLGDWVESEGVRLFRRAVFLHGDNQYVYTFAPPEPNRVPDRAFAPDCPG